MLDHWGWRIMLVAEGALPLGLAGIWIAFIPRSPAGSGCFLQAPTDPHRDAAARIAELERSERRTLLRALMRPQVFVLAGHLLLFC